MGQCWSQEQTVMELTETASLSKTVSYTPFKVGAGLVQVSGLISLTIVHVPTGDPSINTTLSLEQASCSIFGLT